MWRSSLLIERKQEYAAAFPGTRSFARRCCCESEAGIGEVVFKDWVSLECLAKTMSNAVDQIGRSPRPRALGPEMLDRSGSVWQFAVAFEKSRCCRRGGSLKPSRLLAMSVKMAFGQPLKTILKHGRLLQQSGVACSSAHLSELARNILSSGK